VESHERHARLEGAAQEHEVEKKKRGCSRCKRGWRGGMRDGVDKRVGGVCTTKGAVYYLPY